MVFEGERPFFFCFSVLKVLKLTPPLSRHLMKLAPTFQRFHPLSDPPLRLWQLYMYMVGKCLFKRSIVV